jgi:hypothetical protein
LHNTTTLSVVTHTQTWISPHILEFSEVLPGLAKDFFLNLFLKRRDADFWHNSPTIWNAIINSHSLIRSMSQRPSNGWIPNWPISNVVRLWTYSFINRSSWVLLHGKMWSSPSTRYTNCYRIPHRTLPRYITTNMFKSAGIRGQPPHLAANVTTPLMIPKKLLEHVNLPTWTIQLGRKGASQHREK